MPNGEQEQDPEDNKSDDSSEGEEVDSPPRTERRSKHSHGPASVRGKATASTGQTSERPRTSSPAPTEKAPKESKVAASKSQKTLPKIKIDIPVASA